MATATRSDIITLAASNIGVKASGQNLSADDSDLIGKAFDSLLDDLRPTGAVIFSEDSVPEWAQWHLVDMLSFMIGPAFGRPQPESRYNRARAMFVGGAHTARPMRPARGPYF